MGWHFTSFACRLYADVFQRILTMKMKTIPDVSTENWLKRIGIIVSKSWGRILVTNMRRERKIRRPSHFLSIMTFAHLLGIVLILFVFFRRTVRGQDVLKRCFWRLRGVRPIFVTCCSILDLSCDFGCVLQGFFCNCRFDTCFFILFHFSLFTYLSIIFCASLSSLCSKCTYHS